MRFWVSPWSPPAWMKINHDYPVLSSKYNTQTKEKDYLLFYSSTPDEEKEPTQPSDQKRNLFPPRLATQTYFIQDPRYMQAYADMFGRFIDLYKEEGIIIDRVMYQNEAYSYTVYPGCAWTPDATIRFNKNFLIPTMHKTHPEVEVYIGTFNTNRTLILDQIIKGLSTSVKGIGLQWEGRQILPYLHKRYPRIHYICSESECGNGSMDWNAGEHTFFLLADNLGNGCDEYYNWNFILQDHDTSAWGWNQNALIQVDSQSGTFRYTPEYYAYKHFSHFITPGTTVAAYNHADLGEVQRSKDVYMLILLTPEGKHIVTAGNFTDTPQPISVTLGERYLNATLPAHSFNTFEE